MFRVRNRMILMQKLIFVFFTFVNASYSPENNLNLKNHVLEAFTQEKLQTEFRKDYMKTVVPSCESALETRECLGSRPAQ